jgi:hypothetical protein
MRPERSADEPQEIPKRLARLVVERQAPPPPPPPVVREEPELPPVVEPEPVVEQRRVEPEPVVEKEPPPPVPVDTTAQARERARGAGVLQFASQLSALRTNADAAANRLERTGAVGAGSEAAAGVTHCEIVSSELNDPELERGLVQRVLQFQFEARDDIEPITTTKPIDFFPA